MVPDMRNIPMELLRTFSAVADVASITRAASILGRSQPAVSLQMKRLEDIVGAPLCRWDGRRMLLTDGGETLLRYATQILRLNDEAIGSLTRPTLAGHVTVGTPNDFAISFLPRILGRFVERYPNVTLDVSCDLSVNLLEKFASDSAGFDLVLAMHADRATARPLRVWPEQLVWVAGPGHSVWTRRPLPLVVYPDGCIYRRRLMRALEAAGMSSRIVYCSPSLAGLQAAILSGLGVMVLARSTVPDGLQILDEESGLPAIAPVTIAMHRRRSRLSPAAARLVGFIAESLDERWAQAPAARLLPA
jgi:DNA-binding transcriptional LysR family regulator